MTITLDVAATLKFLVIAAFVGIILFVVLTLVRNVKRYFASRAFDSGDRKALQRRWKEIQHMAAAPGETSRRVAVLEADKLLDHALKALGMPGETLADRLKFASYKYPQLRDVWGAHRIRNQLAHEAGYHLDAGVARKAIRAFERALGLLGAI